MDPKPTPTPAPTVIAVAAMRRKLHSAPMQAILRSLRAADASAHVVELDEAVMSRPVDAWPVAHVLLTIPSTAFPLDKVLRYIALRNPLLVNNIHMQPLMQDRRLIRATLRRAGVPVAPALYVDRAAGDRVRQTGPAGDTLIVTDAATNTTRTLHKPFVEKPVDADDHNVYIYYRGGGVRKLFRKVKNQSSLYDAEQTAVRPTGSYVYEQFYEPQHHADIKVYAVGPQYLHAEARKAPHIDGIVERDPRGKEVRAVVTLTPQETAMCNRVAAAFDQFVLGFDLLRGPGRQRFVIDVNGWSLVKNSADYARRCGAMLAHHVRLRLHERRSLPLQALQLARPSRARRPVRDTAGVPDVERAAKPRRASATASARSASREPARRAELLGAERQAQPPCAV